MKRAVCFITVVLLCLTLACPAFAASNEFVPSISYKDHPSVVPTPDGYYGRLVDGNGDLIEGIPEACLAFVSVSDNDSSGIYAALKDGSMTLPYEKVDPSIDADSMVIRDLFEVSIVCDQYTVGNGQNLEVTYDLGVAPGTDVTVMVYADGQWYPAVDVVNNGDGTVTITLDRTGTVAISVPGSAVNVPAPGTGDADMGKIALYGTICGVSLIALIALLVVNAKRKNA